MSEEKTEQLVLVVEKKQQHFLINLDMTTDRAVASPTQPGGGGEFSGGAKCL